VCEEYGMHGKKWKMKPRDSEGKKKKKGRGEKKEENGRR
jgi:hypothetical protein